MTKTIPYKRSSELEKKIIKRIGEGASFSDAPRLEGIDESSFRRWRKCKNAQGEEDTTLRDRRCWDCANCALQKRCDEAESRFKQECVQTIYKAGAKNWKARAWLLERRYRDEYGTKTTVENSGEVIYSDPSRELVNRIVGNTKEQPKEE